MENKIHNIIGDNFILKNMRLKAKFPFRSKLIGFYFTAFWC